jgi:hypothetical protein
MITECKTTGPIMKDNDGVITKRSTMVIHLETGSVITIVPPDPYPGREKQREILDRLHSIEGNAERRRNTSKTA